MFRFPNSILSLLAACLFIPVISCTHHKGDNHLAQCGGAGCYEDPCGEFSPNLDGPFFWEFTTMDIETYPRDIGGSSGSDVYVSSTGGILLHYDGNDWSKMVPVGEAGNSYYSGLWVQDPNNVFVVGLITTIPDWGDDDSADDDTYPTEEGVVLHSDGENWSEMTRVSDIDFQDVWAASPQDAWAVGYIYNINIAVIYHYDGVFWTETKRWDNASLNAVWGSSDSDVYAVGSFTEWGEDLGMILHYDGSEWEKSTFQNTSRFSGLWGSDESDVYAVGSKIYHFNGINWAAVKPDLGNDFTHMKYSAVWGTGPSDVRVVGAISICERSGGVILHFDGTGWEIEDRAIPGSINGIWGSSASDIWAVGKTENGPIGPMILHYDGASNTSSSL